MNTTESNVNGSSEQPTVSEEVRQTLDTLLPWGISFLMHLAVGLLAVFAIWIAPMSEDEPPPIVPTMAPVDAPAPRLTPTEPLGEETSELAVNIEKTDVQQTTPDPWNALGVDGAVDLPRGPKVKPEGWKNRRKGKIIGPDPEGGGPQRVVYVIDASGSMVEKFALVQRDLVSAIHRLGEADRFNVIFFQQDTAITVLPTGLSRGTAKARRLAIERAGEGTAFVRPRGGSNPLPALAAALRLRPARIVLLSDNITGSGRYQIELAALLAEVQRMKQRFATPHTRIDTVQFLRPDPNHALRRLAEQHHGRYRFVTERDLQ